MPGAAWDKEIMSPFGRLQYAEGVPTLLESYRAGVDLAVLINVTHCIRNDERVPRFKQDDVWGEWFCGFDPFVICVTLCVCSY